MKIRKEVRKIAEAIEKELRFHEKNHKK